MNHEKDIFAGSDCEDDYYENSRREIEHQNIQEYERSRTFEGECDEEVLKDYHPDTNFEFPIILEIVGGFFFSTILMKEVFNSILEFCLLDNCTPIPPRRGVESPDSERRLEDLDTEESERGIEDITVYDSESELEELATEDSEKQLKELKTKDTRKELELVFAAEKGERKLEHFARDESERELWNLITEESEVELEDVTVDYSESPLEDLPTVVESDTEREDFFNEGN